MLFPAKSTTLTPILEMVHGTFKERKGTYPEVTETNAARKLAAYLLARNVALASFFGRDPVQELADYFLSPSDFGDDAMSTDLTLVHKVSLFKSECATVNQCAKKAGIIGVLAGLLGEDVLFVSPTDPFCVNWNLPDKDKMKWAAPRVKVRGLPKITDDDVPTAMFESYILDDDDESDEDSDLRVKYTASMLYKNAVYKFTSFQHSFPSEGYAVDFASGVPFPSHYYTSEDEDFLPKDVTERMNTKLHFDPPQGYVRLEAGGNSYKSYHASGAAIPPLSVLLQGQPLAFTSLPDSVKGQLEVWSGADSIALAPTKWIQLYVPQVVVAPRSTIKIALDFSAQWLFHKTGALTNLARGSHRWKVLYVDTSYSYASLRLNNPSIIGVVVEAGAFTASMTRLQVIEGEDDSVSIKYTVLADRGFLRDRSAELDSPLIEVDGRRFKLTFEYVSEWVPTGPGLDRESPDQASGSTGINLNLIGSEGEKFSPLAAYHVTISEVK